MTRKAAQILLRHDLPVTEVDHLEDRLYDHNRRATGRHDGKGLAFVALDERGRQIGAIADYTWAGMAEIKQLWVDQDHRSCGLGRGLLGAAIAEAIDRPAKPYGVSPTTFRHQDFMRSAGSSGSPS